MQDLEIYRFSKKNHKSQILKICWFWTILIGLSPLNQEMV